MEEKKSLFEEETQRSSFNGFLSVLLFFPLEMQKPALHKAKTDFFYKLRTCLTAGSFLMR